MTDTLTADTGTCKQCVSEISIEADRCPECGYEPGYGILGIIIILLSLLWIGIIGVVLAVVWLLVPSEQISMMVALSLTLRLLIAVVPGIVIFYLIALAERKTPTGKMKTWGELWGEA